VPASLRLLLIVLVAAALAYGAVGTWTVIQHASAAQDVVSTSEPLSLAAQRMYQALSGADVTATTAFLVGPDHAVFHSGATAGRNAFTGLDVVIVLAAVLIAAGCAWGLSRRLAEYR